MSAPVTVCFTYFKSLALANLSAALHSLQRQDMSLVDSIVIVDNDTSDSEADISQVIDEVPFTVPVQLFSFKHGDANKTHSWSTNTAVRNVATPWIFFTRADYLLAFSALEKHIAVAGAKPNGWNGFVVSKGCHLSMDIGECEKTAWRQLGPRFSGFEIDYTIVDSGVWLARKDAFDRVGGLDEALTAWGHAQTDFQYRMHKSGVEFVRIDDTLFYHPLHAGHRDLDLAHQQLAAKGADLREMWARHEGARVY